MTIGLWCWVWVLVTGVLLYHRATLTIWQIASTVLLVFASVLGHLSWYGLTLCWSILLASVIVFSIKPLRRQLLTRPIFTLYRRLMPSMSSTEKEALHAGTLSWEKELFSGAPRWRQLHQFSRPILTEEEQAFLQGPVQTLCRMVDDWQVTHHDLDLSEQAWTFIKDNGFFGLIIPKIYGGKQFSAYAHSEILIKLASKSVTLASTVSVPNSLGPAELLLHYGTEEQKNYYLPRLAQGQEIPCFALTGPEAGSDAASIPDVGIVCRGTFEGNTIIGIRINWEKRYITLAPVATLLGLAFVLYDPEQLLGEQENRGITCALIPVQTPGITIGRRHFPLNTPFQNGPTQGKDVFIPLTWIIGGVAMAGQGWRMLMDCLSAGRAISLPSTAISTAKVACYTTGAYARIRKQFNTPIGYFEGVQDYLAKMAGITYMIDAARLLTLSSIDRGEKPAVLSAIVKYHATAGARAVVNYAMDIHGGRAICLGPHNYLARMYQSLPIGITVEGANILTRNLIIFGQGAIRCHPYVLAELSAAQSDRPDALIDFDQALFGHIGFTLSNVVRSVFLGLTNGRLSYVGIDSRRNRPYYQYLTRLSTNFALIADCCMLLLGGELKRKEGLSARLGDVLSVLYMGSAVLKRFYDDGAPNSDRALLFWMMNDVCYRAQEQLRAVLENLPNPYLAWVLKWLTFPLGRRYHAPKDSLLQKIAKRLLVPGEMRDRLTAGIYTENHASNPLSLVEQALQEVIALDPVERRLHKAQRAGQIRNGHFQDKVAQALQNYLLTEDEAKKLLAMYQVYRRAIDVDDFSNEEL